MFAIELDQISKSYGANQVLQKVSWQISTQDKIGLIGDNASGKSTLLRIMAGELKPDGGLLRIASDLTLGYLRQRPEYEPSMRVGDLIEETFAEPIQLRERMVELEREMGQASANAEGLEALLDEYGKVQEMFQRQGGYDYETRAEFLLTQVGLEALDRRQPLNSLSGGEQERLQLACALMRQPNLLLLDEPDNHLDMAAREWLEEFLRGYRGGFVLVSHDRYLLDQVVAEIVEIEDGGLTKYRGNYSRYKEQKERRLTAQYYAYVNQQQAINNLEQSITTLKKWSSADSVKRARQAKSMEKQLDRMERVEKPALERKRMRLDLELQKRGGEVVVEAINLTVIRSLSRTPIFIFGGENVLHWLGQMEAAKLH